MKIFKGKVISTKMEKTATVAVERIIIHPVYKKRYKRTKKYHVHDEFGVNVGDEVKFTESRPYSKLKKWKITEVINKKSSSGIPKKGGRTGKGSINDLKKPV